MAFSPRHRRSLCAPFPSSTRTEAKKGTLIEHMIAMLNANAFTDVQAAPGGGLRI